MRAFFLCLVLTAALMGSSLGITVRDNVSDAQSQSLGNSISVSAVGKLTRPGDTVSGVLIDPRFVLTAAHVTGGAAPNAFTFSIGTSTYQSVRYVVHPTYNGASEDGDDLAIIELDRAVADVTPALLYSGTSEATVQATITGFGLGGNGTSGGTLPLGIKRAATNTIDGTSYLTFTSNRLLFFDFDAPAPPLPGNPAENKIGSFSPTSFEGMFAVGDSGGGVFGTIGSQSFLLGVNSFIVPDNDGIQYNYGDVGAATRVSSNLDFIYSVVPEPSIAALLGWGGILLLNRRRRD